MNLRCESCAVVGLLVLDWGFVFDRIGDLQLYQPFFLKVNQHSPLDTKVSGQPLEALRSRSAEKLQTIIIKLIELSS